MIRVPLTLFCCAIGIAGFSQSEPVSPTRPTPNAASIGVYGEMPVSHFTGMPQIDIPVYVIKSTDFTIPVSVSYYAAGFRPDVHPSWVGANWSLNAGGAITRTVRHFPDEYQPGSEPLNVTLAGYYYSNHLLNTNDWYLPQSQWFFGTPAYDRQPDVFSFNFAGYSGKFFLDHLGNWKVQSNKPLRVDFDPVDFITPFIYNNCNCLAYVQRKTFGKFTITDDKGVKYVFGTADAIEYSVGMNARNYASPAEFDYPSNTIATSWYLVKVIPTAGEEVIFGYERGPYQSSFSYFEYSKGCSVGDIGGSGFLSRSGMTGSYNNGLSGSITSPVYLTTISYKKENLSISFVTSKSNELKYASSVYLDPVRDEYGSLPQNGIPIGFLGFNMTQNIPYFTRNPSEAQPTPSDLSSKFIWLKLDRIDISYSNSISTHDYPSMGIITRKRINFSYTELQTERLKLNEINITDASYGNSQKYKFAYNNTIVPDYLYEITDHWGFSNNNPLLRTSSNTYTAISNMDSYRQPSTNYSLRGLLTEIEYPTGGKSIFYYEGHTYNGYMMRTYSPAFSSTVVPQPGVAGGARIKKIETVDGLGNKTWREYYYESSFNPQAPGTSASSGILEGQAKYSWSINLPTQNGGTYTAAIRSSSSVVPASSTSSGRHIGYSKVIEKNNDGSYKELTFTNHDNGYSDLQPYSLYMGNAMLNPSFSSTELERGKLLTESIYNSAGVLIAKNENTYERVSFNESNAVRSIEIDNSIWCLNYSFSDFVSMSAFYNYTHYLLPKTVKSYSYANGQQLVTESTNDYDNYGNVTRVSVNTSKGDVRETRFTYAYNYPGNTVMDFMKAQNMIGIPITTDKYKQNNTFLESTKFNYALFHGNSFAALSNVQYKKDNLNNPYKTRFSYNSYDTKGNVLEIQKDNDVKTSYIWGYGKLWPVAQIVNADYPTVSSLVNQSIIDWPNGNAQLQQELAALRTNLPNALVSSYLYSFQGDVLSQTDVRGREVKYEYDNLGRLLRVRDDQDNILKQMEYGYKATVSYPFESVARNVLFVKNNCSPGYAGSGSNYILPAGKYGSFISQPDADQKAQADIDLNGQAYANANGYCYPFWSFVTCCGWNTAYNNFTLTGSGSVNFSLVLSKNTGVSTYGQIATLSGPLFLPSVSRAVNVTSGGLSFTLFFSPTGEVQIMGSSFTGYITVSGSYNL